jgi:hypothetical protein
MHITIGEIQEVMKILEERWDEGESIVGGRLIPHTLSHFEDEVSNSCKRMGINYIRKYSHIKV